MFFLLGVVHEFGKVKDVSSFSLFLFYNRNSGDWAAIAPIHSYMAIVSAIENGVAILRPVILLLLILKGVLRIKEKV